jgi:hypothetical protein
MRPTIRARAQRSATVSARRNRTSAPSSDAQTFGPLPNAPRVWPANFGSYRKSVVARDLDGDGEPEVVLGLYTGGAHCCYYAEVYRYAKGSYARNRKVWAIRRAGCSI